MNPAAWERVKSVLADAADLSGPDRERLVADRCPDLELRRDVLELLASPAPISEILATSTLQPGARLGPYVIDRLFDRGGMGEVYRANDTQLDRTVAIKVLPAHLLNDGDRRRRFEREARAISKLNHPHICTLHDIGSQDGIDFLVMEYVDGETLAHRLATGPIPMEQVLRYGIESAEALDHAHRHGIVHRDLKPGNIMLTRAGVKLLDFGLAKLQPEAVSSAPGPLVTDAPQTASGAILGTLGYMAPEQIDGIEADARTDVFALGAVLYEMASGRKALEGQTRASLIAAGHTSEPVVAAMNLRSASPLFNKVVLKCLATERGARWQSALDLADALRWIGEESGTVRSPVPVRRWRAPAAWALAAIAATIGVSAFTYVRDRRVSDTHSIRFTLAAPPNTTLPRQLSGGDPALSPDGRRLAFVAVRAGTPLLWVRSLDTLEAQPLLGTDGAQRPFWSPDNQMLAFFAQRTLKVVSAGGGPTRTLCDAPSSSTEDGGSWSPDGGSIVFGTRQTGLMSVPATGGTATSLTKPDATGVETSLFPTILPDGRRFVYLNVPSKVVWLGSLDSTESARLLSADSKVEYVAPGYLVFMRRGTLMAQRFDAQRGALVGGAVPIVEGVMTSGQGYNASFSASRNGGALVYRSDPQASPAQLTWVDRTGRRLGVVGQPGRYRNPELSPDGTSLALEVLDSQLNSDVWRLDLERGGVMTRLTSDPREDIFPVWSRDSRSIIFSSDRQGGVSQLYRIRADGTGEAELVLPSTTPMIAQKLAIRWPAVRLPEPTGFQPGAGVPRGQRIPPGF